MKIYLLLFLLITSGFLPAFSQEFTAKILDLNTKKPIPYTTVQFGKNQGTITNDEGVFTINSNADKPSTLIISSMGYETSELKFDELMEPVIYLKPQVIQLSDVFITNEKLSGFQILERAKSKVAENYNFEMSEKRFFFRESNLNKVQRFDLDIEKSSIADINQNLMDSISESIPKMTDSYKEILGDFYGNYSSQKLQLIKAANLYNPQSTGSLDKLTKKLDRIFKENVKENSYLKIKSGIFGVKVDADELAEDKQEYEEARKPKEPTQEEKDKAVMTSRENMLENSSKGIKSLLNGMFWKEDITFNLFEKLKRYEYKVEGYTYLDDETVYVIDFKPKSGQDFKGKIYVNASDYGVHRIDYENIKPLKKFRLLGISSVDDVYRGKMIFSKDSSGKYNPKYVELETGDTFGIDRPLTLIEKNKKVIGRNKQNELDMDILIKVSQIDKYQLVVYENKPLQNSDFEVKTISKDFEYETFKKYDPEFWNGYNIIEPNTAIKQFTALQAE